MKIIITGTHFTPAVAVIEKLLKEKDVEVVYVGRKTTREGDFSPSVESQVLPKLGVKFISIISGRFARSFSLLSIFSLLKIPFGFVQAFLILLKEKPQIIVSFGGYTAVPVVVIGWLFSIPILIHEQGLKFGLANKISALFADKIALSFKESRQPDGKTLITGNPLRKEIINVWSQENSEISNFIQKVKEKKRKLILVTGGNQGSHIINLTIGRIIDQLIKTYSVIHITGDSKYHDFESLLLKKNDNYLVCKWIDKEFGFVLKNCDLVVSRGGINTLMEIAFFKKPVIIIPLEIKEQTANARYFQKNKMAKVIHQNELSPQLLLAQIVEVLKGYTVVTGYDEKDISEGAASRLALEILLLGRNL